MRISLTDRTADLPSFVKDLSERSLSYQEKTLASPRVSELRIAPAGAVDDLTLLDLDFLFDYRVFPESILRAYGAWRLDGRRMREGDVIVQQVNMPPGPVALRCIFGVRVLEVVRSAREMAFSYGTLAGHVERGIARFAIELRPDGLFAVISVRAARRSAPVALAERIAVTPVQRSATRRSLAWMRSGLLAANPIGEIPRGR